MTAKQFSALAFVGLLVLSACVPLTSSSIDSSVASSSSPPTSSEATSPSSSSEVLVEYTITFESNGGTAVTAISAYEGGAVTAPTPPTKTGYTFAGWYADAALTTVYAFTTMPDHDVTVYAKWTINQYTISFESNGGSAVSSLTQNYGTVVTEPSDPTKTGYTFSGWYSNIGLTTAYTFTTMPASNLTLYAKWTINQYTIAFEEDGGTAIADITQDYGSSVTAPTAPTKEGYTFSGWYSDIALTEPYLFTTMPAENITLYAKWLVDYYYGAITIEAFKALPAEDTNEYDVVGVMIMDTLEGGAPAVIADSTGVLVVMNPSVLLYAGDLVRYHGIHTAFEGVPIMDNGSTHTEWVTVYEHEQAIPYPPEVMTIAAFNALDPLIATNYMIYAEISGTMSVDDESHMITLQDGLDTMNVFPMSQEEYQDLIMYRGLSISIRGLIFPNFDVEPPFLMYVWNGEPVSLDYETDEALLDALSALFLTYFGAMDYIPGQYVELPIEHPFIPVTITYETFGDNAALFNVETGMIDDAITTALDIGVHVTFTLPSTATKTFDLMLHVIIPEITPIATFETEPDFIPELGGANASYYLQGIVLAVTPAGDATFAIIIDSSGVAFVFTNRLDLVVGDEILAYGYKMTQGTMPILYNDPSVSILSIKSHGNSIPMNPVTISIADFLTLTPATPEVAFTYYEVSGTLIALDPENPSVFGITNGMETVPVYAIDDAARTTLAGAVDQSVTIRGLSIIGGDPGSEMILLAYFAFPDTLVVVPD